MLEKIKRYLKETAAELRKMTWPTMDELKGSTIVVIIVSLVVAIFIGVVDRVLTFMVRTIFGGTLGG
ncbi:MAG: preprotein translocase subunit SecE [bacterium]|nr:preprotein translocase subunit SecE [bacterium]